MDWQPIETAPKDTWLLLYVPSGVDERSYEVEDAPLLTIGRWSAAEYQQAAWHSVESWTEYTDYGGYTGVSVSNYQTVVNPTHWMPPPEPPRDSDGSGEAGQTA